VGDYNNRLANIRELLRFLAIHVVGAGVACVCVGRKERVKAIVVRFGGRAGGRLPCRGDFWASGFAPIAVVDQRWARMLTGPAEEFGLADVVIASLWDEQTMCIHQEEPKSGGAGDGRAVHRIAE